MNLCEKLKLLFQDTNVLLKTFGKVLIEFRMSVLIDISQIAQLSLSLLPTQRSKLLSSLAWASITAF